MNRESVSKFMRSRNYGPGATIVAVVMVGVIATTSTAGPSRVATQHLSDAASASFHWPYQTFSTTQQQAVKQVVEQVTNVVRSHAAAASTHSTAPSAGSSLSSDIKGIEDSIGAAALNFDDPEAQGVLDDAAQAVQQVQQQAQAQADQPATLGQADLDRIVQQTVSAHEASPQDVVQVLLFMLTQIQTMTFTHLATAEAALIAIIDNAEALLNANAAAINMPEIVAFAIGQMEFAKQQIHAAFAMIRAQLTAKFTEVANLIIEKLTGVDFGPALDEVLAQLAQIQAFLTDTLAHVNDVLNGVLGQLQL
jgi:hypothetical protein